MNLEFNCKEIHTDLWEYKNYNYCPNCGVYIKPSLLNNKIICD